MQSNAQFQAFVMLRLNALKKVVLRGFTSASYTCDTTGQKKHICMECLLFSRKVPPSGVKPIIGNEEFMSSFVITL
jgi:hypothetical protein